MATKMTALIIGLIILAIIVYGVWVWFAPASAPVSIPKVHSHF